MTRVYEVKLGDEFLMSTVLHGCREMELARLVLAELAGDRWLGPGP